jgi:integrase
MASIVKRCRHPRPEWPECGCTWYLRDRSGGRETHLRLGPDRAAAEAMASRLAQEWSGGSERMSALCDRWLALRAAERDARPNTLITLRIRAAHVREWFGPIAVSSVRPEHVRAFVDAQRAAGRAEATIGGIYSALRGILVMALRDGLIRSLPLPPEGPGLARSVRRHDITLAECERVIAAIPGLWGQVAELILLTGLRWGEATAIRRDDVVGSVLMVRRTRNRRGGTNDPKTRTSKRALPLSGRALEILAGLDLPVGGSYSQARRVLVHAMRECGVWQPGMGWHTLRHAHATLLDHAGVSLRDAAHRMGHGANYAQTLAYRVAVDAGDASGLDAVRHAAARTSGSPGRRPERGRPARRLPPA